MKSYLRFIVRHPFQAAAGFALGWYIGGFIF